VMGSSGFLIKRFHFHWFWFLEHSYEPFIFEQT
jgi:hypothetical protein